MKSHDTEAKRVSCMHVQIVEVHEDGPACMLCSQEFIASHMPEKSEVSATETQFLYVYISKIDAFVYSQAASSFMTPQGCHNHQHAYDLPYLTWQEKGSCIFCWF